MINKFFQYIFLSLLSFLTLFFLYSSYKSYKEFNIKKNSNPLLTFINKSNKLLDSLQKEQTLSATYLATKGRVNFEKLREQRDVSDTTLNDLINFSTAKPYFSGYIDNLNELSNNLQYARSRVDVLNSDYRSLLLENYQTDIINKVSKIITLNYEKLKFGLKSLTKYFSSLINLSEIKNGLNKEKNYIGYIILNHKKMDNQDLSAWEKILKEQPLVTNNNENNTSNLQQEINSLSHVRSDVLTGSLTGQYTISHESWNESIDKRIFAINSIQLSIFHKVKEKIKNIAISLEKTMWNVGITLLLLASLLISAITIKKNNAAKKRFLDIKQSIKDKNRSKNKTEFINKSPKYTNKTTSFNPAKEISEMIENSSKKADKRFITINYFIDSSIDNTYKANLQKIKQIINNLLNHAIRSTKSYGFINLKVENSGEKKDELAITFSILESGIKMTEEYRNKIKRTFINEEVLKTKNFKTRKSDLITTAKLIANIDGLFEINLPKDEDENKQNILLTFTFSAKKLT